MTTLAIHHARPEDRNAIKQLAVDAGLFADDEVDGFDEMLDGFFDASMDGHVWIVIDGADGLDAAAYYAPEPFADRVWNLYFLAVDPSRHGCGAGSAMVEHVEHELRARGPDVARILIVETSSTDQYVGTRAFYAHRGFHEESTIREFYGPGDHKVTFWKSLRD